MFAGELGIIGLSLLAALSWGAGDFNGGLATRRATVYGVVITGQIISLFLLGLLGLSTGERAPSGPDILYGALAGLCGAVGLSALYAGLARGKMGAVAAIASVVAAGLPVTVGIFADGIPPALQVAGFALALLGVWLIAGGSGEARMARIDLGLALLAGTGFGVGLIALGQLSGEGLFWPIVSARIASITGLLIVATALGQRQWPPRGALWLVALSGVLDAFGNIFFILASQVGRLDIAAVIGSLYPAFTVLLAWVILREQMLSRQWLGIGAALVAIVFIAI